MQLDRMRFAVENNAQQKSRDDQSGHYLKMLLWHSSERFRCTNFTMKSYGKGEVMGKLIVCHFHIKKKPFICLVENGGGEYKNHNILFSLILNCSTPL